MKKNIPHYPEIRGIQIYDAVTGKYYPVAGDADGRVYIGDVVAVSEDNKAQVVYEDGDILYVCKAVIGSIKTSPVWQIKKVDGMDIEWCDGDALYNNVATSLEVVELLSYS